MSALKKIMIGLAIVISLMAGLVFYSNYQRNKELETAFRKNDKILALYYLTVDDTYVNQLRDEGYRAFGRDSLMLDNSEYALELDGELPIKLGFISDEAKEITVDFNITVNAKNILVQYTLDKNLTIRESSLSDSLEDSKISPEQKAHYLSLIQKEINECLDKMKERLYPEL